MICNKCNQTLPDDSEFCQYCGSKLAKAQENTEENLAHETAVSDETANEVAEKSNDEMTSEEEQKELFEAILVQTKDFMEANSRNQPHHEGEDDFGLVPEKPIYTLATKLVDGEIEYLNRLYTTNGEKIMWNREGSLSIDRINGLVDVYHTYLPSGQPYKTIYINMYGAKASTSAPAGFSFSKPSIAATSQRKPQRSRTPKVRYCSRCGSLIDSNTKKCSGCGRQYFKGIKFNKFSVTVGILAVALVVVSTLYISQTAKARFLNKHIEIVNYKDSTIYHKYDCPRLDRSKKVWVYTSTTIPEKYKKCSKCH